MKWVYASVIAVMTGVCSGASAQSTEPASSLLQTVQYGGYNDFNGYNDYNGYDNRGYGYSRRGGGYYNRGYGDRRYRDYRRRDDGAAVAAGVVGLALGAAIASQNQRYARRGVASTDCTRYRSFDPASGTFVGRDGRRHYCR
jgi:hypothetical protein